MSSETETPGAVDLAQSTSTMSTPTESIQRSRKHEDIMIIIINWIFYAFGWLLIGLSFIWDYDNSPKTAMILVISGALIAAYSMTSFSVVTRNYKNGKVNLNSLRWVMPWALGWALFGIMWRFRADEWAATLEGPITEAVLWIIWAVLISIAIREFIYFIVRRRMKTSFDDLKQMYN